MLIFHRLDPALGLTVTKAAALCPKPAREEAPGGGVIPPNAANTNS